MACPVFIPDGNFTSSLMSYVDCQALAMGEGGYRALASTGSPVMMVLAGLLTIVVALFGYRMVFGQTPQLTDLVAPIIKIGLVLTFLFSWSAYRTVAYDVTMRGPAELAARIGGATDVPGMGGGLVILLQRVDRGLAELGRLGTGRQQPQVGPTPAQNQTSSGAASRRTAANTGPVFDQSIDREADAAALRSARTWFLMGTVGALAVIRLVAGLLLALGPVFLLFMMFDVTRDLFGNWARALGWSVLSAIGVTMSSALQLAFLEPWLAAVLSLRRASLPTTANPAEFMALTMMFAVISFAIIIASGWVMRRIALPDPSRWGAALRGAERGSASSAPVITPRLAPAEAERSRALHIADAVTNLTRREASRAGGNRAQTAAAGAAAGSGRTITSSTDYHGPGLAHHSRRRTRNRVSASAIRRNGTA